MPNDWTPSLVTVTPGSFDNIWVLDPRRKVLDEMQPTISDRKTACALTKAVGARFYLTKRRRVEHNDWVWVAHDAARKKDDPLAAREFPTQDMDGPVMWMMYRSMS